MSQQMEQIEQLEKHLTLNNRQSRRERFASKTGGRTEVIGESRERENTYYVNQYGKFFNPRPT